MKNIYLFLGLLFSAMTFGQQEVISIKGDFKTIEESFNVIDPATGNLVLFLKDRKQVYGALYDKENKQIGAMSAPELSNKFSSFIGHQIAGNKISLFMNSANGRNYGRLIYDFDNKKTSTEEFDFKLKGEKYINAASRGDKMYLFAIPKNSDLVKIYVFGESQEPDVHEIDLAGTGFYDSSDRPENLYDFMSVSQGWGAEVDTGEIEDGVPNSIETTSKQVKFYNLGDKIVLSMDKSSRFTYLLTIDLISFEKNLNRIEKPQLIDKSVQPNSNSFLDDHKLYQIVASTEEMKFQIIDLKADQKSLKAIALSQDEDILFKNTPIIQEGGIYDSYRELEKTSKFLRKIKNGDIGISPYVQDNTLQLTLGSATKIQTGGGGMYMGGGFVGGAIGGIAVSFNPMWSAYSGYTRTKSVRITGLFDKDFNHLDGEVPQNPFDRINEFSEEQKNITAETIFKKEGAFYWGAYSKEDDQFHIYRF